MLIPYKDENPTSKFPLITVCIIILNVAAYLYQIFGSMGYENFIMQFALIPQELFTGKNLASSSLISPYATVFTFMFVHGSFLHLAFNMLFLWIFGNNVEDRMTRIGFTVFYLLSGIISGILFSFIAGGTSPLVGASGAISGILGAYLFMFPFARVRAIFIIFSIRMPSFVFILLWFFTQITSLLEIGRKSNVAWEAHVSGFLAGVILFKLFTVNRRKKDIRIM